MLCLASAGSFLGGVAVWASGGEERRRAELVKRRSGRCGLQVCSFSVSLAALRTVAIVETAVQKSQSSSGNNRCHTEFPVITMSLSFAIVPGVREL